IPSRLRIEAGGEARSVDIPDVAVRDEPGSVSAVEVRFPALRGDRVRITVEEIRPQLTRDWYGLADIEMPVGIVELGVPGAASADLREELDDTCRPDLLTVDGRPLTVRVSGAV